MGITIHNKSAQTLDIWTSMAGPLQWNNSTKPGESTVLDPGWVWVTVNAKVNSGSDNEITTGKAITGNLLPIIGFIGGPWIGALVLGGIIAAQNTGVFNNSVLPEKAREYIDAGAVVVDPNCKFDAVNVKGVYGKNNDVDVTGGEVKVEIQPEGKSPAEGGKLVVTSVNALSIREL